MSSGKLFALGLVAFVVSVGLLLGSSYVSYSNYGNAEEVLIEKTYQNNENIYSQYGNKVVETAQVPDMYKKAVIEATTAAIKGRYGEEGSKAVFQMIKEQNPTIDPKMYEQIQRVIESGRNDFQSAQTTLIDVERQYQTSLGNVWSGYWLKKSGYPKIDLAKYQPIETEKAIKAFDSGVDSPIQLQ